MKSWKGLLSVAALLVFAGQAVAQTADEDSAREMAQHELEYSTRLKEAEERMAEAARQIAEITSKRMPQIEQLERRFAYANQPRIGVTIDSTRNDDPVVGVTVEGVTPGSAADDVGLRAGDVITAVNGESMSADSSDEANKRLLDFMHGVEEGDVLNVDYLRSGDARSVEVAPRIIEMHAFAWAPNGGQQMHIEKLRGLGGAPKIIREFRMDFGFPWAGSGLGSMELVELNAGLGKYFGTDSGLLVVSAPDADGIELRDGDVIQSIDGRTPTDVRHAMRILSSYQSGETLELGIMRDKKKRTLEIEIPADRRSGLLPLVPAPIRPARVVAPPAVSEAAT